MGLDTRGLKKRSEETYKGCKAKGYFKLGEKQK